MALIDISRAVSPATAVWPGDQKVQWNWTRRLSDQDASVNLGSICLSTHAGTHVDAPFHVSEEGATTSQLPLSVFVGPATVISVESASQIRPEHVEGPLEERVLFKTQASTLSDDQWPDSITPIAPETVEYLNSEGTVLLGTDAPSLDPLDSTALPAHQALIDAGIVNLEGLSLEQVPPAEYFLMALPLKIEDGDAAPVRAVLHESPPV